MVDKGAVFLHFAIIEDFRAGLKKVRLLLFRDSEQ